MKTKSLLISVVVLLAVLLSACGAAGLPGSGSTPRVLTVSGVGVISLQPDMASISVGVHTETPSAADSVAQNNAKTQTLIDALKAAGVDAKDIQTMNFSIWQNMQYSLEGKPTSTNYAVDNTVNITVRDLGKLGDLLDAAVRAGANNINSIQFDVADKTKAMTDARAEAVKTAKAQAAELATAAGVTLGNIQSIQYFDASPNPVFPSTGMGGGGNARADMAVPINPGQMQITVTVTMAYDIK